MRVTFKNPTSGELRDVKIGWSWTLLFFSSFLGLPLFLRKLNAFGAVFLTLSVIDIVTAFPQNEFMDQTGYLVAAIEFAISVWLAATGNAMTAKNYLELGWKFLDPDSEVAKFAKGKWGIA